MRLELRMGWLIVLLPVLAQADEPKKDWTCVPTVDGKAWDCGYGKDKPEQRFLATPPVPHRDAPTAPNAPLGFADPGASGPIGIAPMPSNAAQRRRAPAAPPARAVAPANPPAQLRIVTGESAPTPAPPPAAKPTAAAPKPVPATARPAPVAATGAPRGWTIQVIGLSRAAGIDTVAAQWAQVPLKQYRLTTNRNGAAWHVLTVGEFASVAAARAALAEVPAALKAGGAFPREVAALSGQWR
jgi:DamX protein